MKQATATTQWRSGRAHRVALGAGLVAAALTLAACSGSSSSGSSGASMTVKVSISQVQGTAMYDSAVKFGDLVKKYTDGRVTVKVYPNSELGSSTSILTGCENGTIAVCAEAGLSTVDDAVQVPQTAYLFPSYATMQSVVNAPAVRAQFAPDFARANLSFMGFWGVGPSDIFTTSKTVQTPADLKGLRLRVANSYLGGLQYSPLGADPVNLSSDQITTALSTHEIDGMDEPITTVTSAGWDSEMHHLSITQDAFIQTPVAASQKFLDKLSAADRSSVEKAFLATMAGNLSESQKDETAALQKLTQSGVDVTNPDTAPFRQAEAGVLTHVRAKYAAVTKALLAGIAATKSSS